MHFPEKAPTNNFNLKPTQKNQQPIPIGLTKLQFLVYFERTQLVLTILVQPTIITFRSLILCS